MEVGPTHACGFRWPSARGRGLLEVAGLEPGFVHWVEEVVSLFGEFDDLFLFEGVFDAVDVGGGLEVVVFEGLQCAEAFDAVEDGFQEADLVVTQAGGLQAESV